jgi:hypothetical protein
MEEKYAVDGMPDGLSEDLVKLRTALAGIKNPAGWGKGAIGIDGDTPHCDRWLLVATDGDIDETTRLALVCLSGAAAKAEAGEAGLDLGI